MTPQQFVAYVEGEFKPAPMLFSLIPNDKLDWRPKENMFTIRALIHHLSGRTGVYGIVKGDWSPEKCWADADKPEKTTPELATKRLERALEEARTLLGRVNKPDWDSKQVETPWGEKGTMEAVALGLIVNHFLHHKMQLFLYLKLLGVPVDTGVLYMGLPPGKAAT